MRSGELLVELHRGVEGLDPSLDQDWFQGVARAVLQRARPGQALSVGIVLADDDTVQELNAAYRGADEPTDVLSFGLGEGEPFPAPPDAPALLGEIVIAYPHAVRQALLHGRTVPYEIGHLTIHGLLHLLGYDHARPEEEAAMREREDAALVELFGVADRRGWDH